MAASATTYPQLVGNIRSGQLSPVYLIHGEEGYYIDQLVKLFEQILPEADREFNQYILYAPETSMNRVGDLCYRYPMMAERQIVIVKEMQAARADDVDRLAKYVLNPNPTTILVLVFRGATAKGKELMTAAKKKAVIYESTKVKDKDLPDLITQVIKNKGMNPDYKAVEMLRDYVGSDLSRLYNEIDKLSIILGTGATVTPEAVEKNIGISKEYNNFELLEALAARDPLKSMKIAEYFQANPKANPLVMTTALLYGYFSDLLIAMYSADKSDSGLMKALGMKSAWGLKKFRTGMSHYSARQVIEVIWALRQFDTRSKGNGSRQDSYNLFHDLIFHILTARGDLGI